MYFAKKFEQLEKNKQNKIWDRFSVGELRGKTMGIIGCGGTSFNIYIVFIPWYSCVRCTFIDKT
jgi:hypothetical protein